MALFLDITTSAEFWRRVYPADRTPKGALEAHPRDAAYSAADAARLSPSWATPALLEPIGGKLHVLVFHADHRRVSKAHATHLWASRIPRGSFYALNDNVLVMAPVFMFLMAAAMLDEHRLIAFGCELCGLYSFDDTAERGFRSRSTPLMTVEALRQYLEDATGCPGHRKAKRALAHLIERSASPMETFDALALFSTYRLGGYNLGKPTMNLEVKLTPQAARIAKRSRCYLDMGFPGVLLDIEHHGAHDHSSPENRTSDRARVNALAEMGYTVIELTSDQVNDLRALEIIVKRIAKLLGKRLDSKKLGATPARLTLRKRLFAWNHSSGRLR